MSNPLRDQLKKAKLLSKKDAKRLAHEQRVERKAKGREGVERDAAARKAELASMQAEKRSEDRERQEERTAADAERAEQAACRELLRREASVPRGRGPGSRWFFETSDGYVPVLSVDATTRSQLEAGQLRVVRVSETALHAYGVIAAEHGDRIRRHYPDRVVWPTPSS